MTSHQRYSKRLTIVVVENEGIVDEILGIKDTPKAYPIVPPSFQTRGTGKIGAAYNVGKITANYIWKYHKRKLLGSIGLGGGVIALQSQNTSVRSLTIGQARSNMVKFGTKRFVKRIRPTKHCCTTCV